MNVEADISFFKLNTVSTEVSKSLALDNIHSASTNTPTNLTLSLHVVRGNIESGSPFEIELWFFKKEVLDNLKEPTRSGRIQNPLEDTTRAKNQSVDSPVVFVEQVCPESMKSDHRVPSHDSNGLFSLNTLDNIPGSENVASKAERSKPSNLVWSAITKGWVDTTDNGITFRLVNNMKAIDFHFLHDSKIKDEPLRFKKHISDRLGHPKRLGDKRVEVMYMRCRVRSCPGCVKDPSFPGKLIECFENQKIKPAPRTLRASEADTANVMQEAKETIFMVPTCKPVAPIVEPAQWPADARELIIKEVQHISLEDVVDQGNGIMAVGEEGILQDMGGGKWSAKNIYISFVVYDCKRLILW